MIDPNAIDQTIAIETQDQCVGRSEGRVPHQTQRNKLVDIEKTAPIDFAASSSSRSPAQGGAAAEPAVNQVRTSNC
jgi:hypothetical protein